MSALADGAALAPGIYPHSERLVQAIRDLARSRTTADAVEEQRREDRELLLGAQRESGLAPQCDGMLDWQDLFRPLVEASDGLRPSALVRFLDRNTFFRAVAVDGTPRLQAPLPPPKLQPPWLATLPSPFAFAQATGDALTPTELAERVLAPQIAAWANAGCELLVLAEPFLPRQPERVDELLAALERLPRPVPVALQLSYGNAAPLLSSLAGAAVDAVGVDFYATPLDALPADFPKPLLAGVIDGTSSLVEQPGEIVAFIEALRARRPAAVLLTPNGDLEHVPETIAREKLRRLGAAAAAVRAAS